MTKEQKFYKALQDVFIGAKVEGKGGFVNLMRIKSNYYRKIEDILKKDIKATLKSHPKFRDELFDKLYSFFSRYFTESGSIYFNTTPFHNNIYEKVYTDEKDVILFWKTQMLYYVKTDRIFRSLPVEFPSERGVSEGRGVFKFYFDASKIESKKANEKRSLIFELSPAFAKASAGKKVRDDDVIVFKVSYSERGAKTKQDEILKAIKRKGIAITEEQLERAFRVFKKQSEVDFFINKNAKAFLQEQFKLWSYQYFWEGAKEWGADRVNQLQILKGIAFKIIDFISQFEDELVKIWNKPKLVKNSNYVITLDRIPETKLIEKILKHSGIKEQIKEWQELGIVDEKFKVGDVFENSPSLKGWQAIPLSQRGDCDSSRGVLDGVVKWNELPFNTELKERARELRKAGNLSEVLFWNQVKNKQFLGIDFDRQKIIGNYIVDFYCKNLGVVVEIDGISHDGKIEYDKQRDDYLKSVGLKVIHILDSDVKNNLSGTIEFLKRELEHPVPSGHPSIRGEFKHLPIDTKYFKDLELEILSQFDDLDKSLDGWLIKSENYQALNTILPKFKEKVQTIYIDPPFNTGDDFSYVDRYQDSSWLSLIENRTEMSKYFLNNQGSFFINLDENADYLGRILLEELNFEEVKKITFDTNATKDEEADLFGYKSFGNNFALKSSTIYFCKNKDSKFYKLWKPNRNTTNLNIGWLDLIALPKKDRNKYNKIEDFDYFIEKYDTNGHLKYLKIDINEKIYPVGDIWNDIYSFTQSEMRTSENLSFQTQKPENFLRRVIQVSSTQKDIIFDFFGGSGTTYAVAHKLNRKWLGVEMGEHFYSVVLPRMKKVLAYDKSGISKEVKTPRQTSSDTPLQEGNYQGGGFFKYYELEQYEEALANCKYEDGDLFNSPLIKGWHSEGMTGYWSDRSPYQEYVFMKDEKMLKALEIDYEKEKVKVDLIKLYPNIDIAETLSNLTGKWIKKIDDGEVEFEDGTKINIKDLDYKFIKPLIWWE